MADYLDDNDRDVALLVEAFDGLVGRVETYLKGLDRQLGEARAQKNENWARHLETGRRQTQALLDLLEGEAFDLAMRLKDNQHHIRMSRAGKLV